jgi:flagellar motor switch protein FliM
LFLIVFQFDWLSEADEGARTVRKVLSQQEIDAILGKARSELKMDDGGNKRVVQTCDFRTAGQMSEAYARFLTNLYEGFARSASNSLGAFLRAHFEMVLASVEQMPVRDFVAAYQETGFVAVLSLHPGDTAVLLQVDNALVFPVIDVLLGGSGAATLKAREMTEIDRGIMEGVAHVLCRQLEATWQSMAITVRLDRQQNAAQIENVFPSTEKLIALTFEVKLNETAGAVNLLFPASFAAAMLREISADPRKKVPPRATVKSGLRQRVLDCAFSCTVGIANLRVPLREVAALKPGSVLNLGLSIKTPASLILGGREYFDAIPVRSGKLRAAQLLRQVRQVAEGRE